ncbi:hypothetical protein HPB52_023089 [Rhipicephalus sanguineus]|uniref:Uncharacterized protein n=1 Tax=Rhipicephalus sanguineus TaxID=34632 RepID=A0A9D4Q8T3_RHISA|nr:hypothetical protein HPB52_023089 [Rhipicephalus sanguineus]
MEPFRVVEREGFLQFVTVAVLGYKLPSRDDLREKFLPGKSLAGAEYVCIALDVWTSPEGFLAVEATFVDSDFAAHTYLLSFTRLTGSHTGARIRCEYDATLLQWNIADKVLRVVTDNASSMIKAFAFTGWETEEDDDDDNFDDCPERFTKELLSEFHQLEEFRFGCAAHSLHLDVKDAIRQDCLVYGDEMGKDPSACCRPSQEQKPLKG